jgi:hypothetical protein
VLALRHSLQWDGGDGGTMAKKDAVSKRLIRPKTTEDYLERLPQFEPRPIPFADLNAKLAEYRRQCWRLALLVRQGVLDRAAAVDRLQEIAIAHALPQGIDDVLSKFMAPYVRDATKLEPFLKDAKRAIAGYVGARETEYDRRKAKKLLSATSIALETTKRKLQEIARWSELSSYLKRLHRDAGLEEQSQASSRKQTSEPLNQSSVDQQPVELPCLGAAGAQQTAAAAENLLLLDEVRQELRRRADLDRNYSDFAPDQIAWRLSQLETIVSLADERVTFGPGDAQQDKIAQDFTDQLASAWHSASERNPTCSRRTSRLKKPSPFARLLETINQRLLKERHRSPNNFFEYGVKAIKRLPSAKPAKRRRSRRHAF